MEWRSVFHRLRSREADGDGHPECGPLKNALEELAFFSTEVRILGVYPASEFRKGLGYELLPVSQTPS